MSGTVVEWGGAAGILTKTGGFLSSFDYSLNPYRGCTFGCSYCYAARYQYNAALERNWSKWLKVKANAPDLLRLSGELGRIKDAAIYMSTVTDPYVPEEKKVRVTRACLEVLVEYRPRKLVMQTRGPLIERDVDLLRQIGENVIVSFSVPTDRDVIRRLFENGCPSVERRLRTLASLKREGIRVFAAVAPVLPCNPVRLSKLLDSYVEGVVVSDFRDDGANGNRTLQGALDIIKANGWSECLEPGYAESVAEEMRIVLGSRVLIGQKGFNQLASL